MNPEVLAQMSDKHLSSVIDAARERVRADRNQREALMDWHVKLTRDISSSQTTINQIEVEFKRRQK